jgi:hypothetical protein
VEINIPTKFSWEGEDKILERPGCRLEGFVKFDFLKKVCDNAYWI